MAELGPLIISPDPKAFRGTSLDELLYSGAVKPLPVFGYMDTSLSVVIRFSEVITTINDLNNGDPLNPESYWIQGARILTVLQFDTKSVRLILNKAPVYSPETFAVMVMAQGIHESVTILSIDERPVEQPTIATDMTDIMVHRVGQFAGGANLTAGDYELSGTIETIKKLVYEVMLVQRGEMLHDPEFGNVIRLKQPQNTALLIEQGRDLRSRIMRLPMIDSCVVSSRFGDAPGSEQVIFTAKVKTKSGTEVSVNSSEFV